jgi:hypothetical protein
MQGVKFNKETKFPEEFCPGCSEIQIWEKAIHSYHMIPVDSSISSAVEAAMASGKSKGETSERNDKSPGIDSQPEESASARKSGSGH